MLKAPYMVTILHIGMKMRVACCSLVYRKVLRLSKAALGETTIGQMVNLLSNDVNRFDIAVLFAQYLCIGPLQVLAASYFMYQQVGVSAIIGVIALLLFVPLQFEMAKLIAKFRYKMAYRTDERVRLMNEVVSGIQVIKMYTWEKPFAKFVSLARRNEVKFIRKVSYLRGVIYSFFIFGTQFCLFVSIMSYILFGEHITAEKVFVLNSFYNVIRLNMWNFFVQAVAQIAEANVSIKRLNDFLVNDERILNSIISNNEEKTDSNPSENSVAVINGNAKWNEAMSNNIFENLNINVKRGSTVAVIGPVGSGKSSLLSVILKELSLTKGKLQIDGCISYAAQESWIFNGTVRQNILFGKPFNKVRYKRVIRVCSLSRDFDLFPDGDKTSVGDRGVSLSGGQRARINLARAVYREADIYLLDDPLSAVDTHVGRKLFRRCINGFLEDKTVILVTHQVQFLKDVDGIVILEGGCVKAQGTFEQLQESGLDFAKLLKSEVDEKEVKREIVPAPQFLRQTSICSTNSFQDISQSFESRNEETTKGTVTLDIYKSYITAGANWFFVLCIIFLFVASQAASSFGDVFISRWVTVEENRFVNTTGLNTLEGSFWDLSTNTYIYIYTGITVTVIILALSRSLSFFTVCMRSSTNLHDEMFTSIIHGTMKFFNTNPTGRILNSFSKDMGAIDELLPGAMLDYVQLSLADLAIVAVIASVNPWLLIPTVLISIVLFCLRRFYLATSRSVKRLEGVTRSPVFGHLNASLQGLTTIRAFRAESILIEEFDSLQDLHSSAWYLFITTSQAFAYWLDFVCVIYICIVTFSFLVIDDSLPGGNVGLAITQSLGLVGTFQWTIRQSAETENQMTAVERVLEYNKIEHEKTLEKQPPKDWPQRGEIKFVGAFLNYFPEDPPVLKNLSFCIKPLEKVGIVGRTGAGKSSLINALFQLTDTRGSILIDGVNIEKISLKDLRSRISIIPQEPVLFSGTMRSNLDPFDEYSDESLWRALNDVELKEAVGDLCLGLNSAVLEGGSNYSVGQRQLICLARAILRNNKVLILDEATANVDPQTDAVIQTTIRKQFAQRTVLTIAHRLNTIMDSDKVLVMNAGRMVEFDHPYKLLENTNGTFYSMVQQTGPSMANTLTKLAKKCYEDTLKEDEIISLSV
ncbi:hypothetical protein RI129_005428 [Pyrocoelia pectoralis]|uniref:Multidrug resistance-associated protein lethal(2)03659 n=1 Tax=Pyrocoelia pectoralis TaxID=417401 RepID=A0AAN7VMQ3_9COLE